MKILRIILVALAFISFQAHATETTVATVSPSSLSFGNQTVGTTGASQTVTLTNSGPNPWIISGIMISNSLDYTATTTCLLDPALDVGASCTISNVFSPSSAGIKTGTITIASNAAGSPTTISLSGTGITGVPDCLFNWAEQNYAQYFSPAGAASAIYTPYYYRYYSGTGNYLAVSSADNHVWVLGPSFGNSPVDVGPTTSFLGVSGCQ